MDALLSSPLRGVLIGAALGFILSRATAALDRRIQRRKVARNLAQEVRRLRQELGSGRVTPIQGNAPLLELPLIHPWMQQLVPDAALIRADIVGAFMELDRCLSNLRVFEKRHIRAVGERKAGGDPAANSAEESLEHRRLREAAEDTGTDYRAEHNKILQLLDQIDRMLSRFV